MEMVMTLIGKRLPSQRLEIRDNYPSKDEHSGRFSASSSSTKFTSTVKKSRHHIVTTITDQTYVLSSYYIILISI